MIVLGNPVPEASYCQYVSWVGGVFFEFVPQLAYVHVYDSIHHLLTQRIERIQELFSCKEPPRRIHE